MAAPEIIIESGRFDSLVAALGDVARFEYSMILREETRQFLRLIMVKTPPFKTKGSGVSESDLSVGRKAVARDLKKTMRPVTPEQMTRNKRMAQVIRAGDMAAYNAIVKGIRSGPLAGTRAVEFSRTLHTSQRNRYGHVGRDRKQIVFSAEQWTAYQKELWTRVGILKSGWNAAMMNPALKHGDNDAMKIPNYVRRHGTKFGAAVVVMEGDLPFIDMVSNSSKWPRYKELVRDTLRVRENAMFSKMSRVMAGKATNLGFAHTLG